MKKIYRRQSSTALQRRMLLLVLNDVVPGCRSVRKARKYSKYLPDDLVAAHEDAAKSVPPESFWKMAQRGMITS